MTNDIKELARVFVNAFPSGHAADYSAARLYVREDKAGRLPKHAGNVDRAEHWHWLVSHLDECVADFNATRRR